MRCLAASSTRSWLGPRTAEQLLAAVDHPAEIFRLPPSQLQRLDGIGPAKARAISGPHGDELAPPNALLPSPVRIITRNDPAYPEPYACWPTSFGVVAARRTDRARSNSPLVRPRRLTVAGHRHTRRFCQGFARSGITVVSGLARGIDTVAHESVLNITGGRTIGVIGSGLHKLYPQENTELAERICGGNGCILSELPLATPPSPGTFPRRNRLVAP